MKHLRDLDLRGKRVLVRVDFNVPLDDGAVADDTRIREALPTIRHILEQGGTPVLMSHLGRPKSGPEPKFSLAPVARHLEGLLGRPVVFCEATVGDAAAACVAGAPEGGVVLLENTRFLPGETTNDEALARQLAALADVYVSDAFGSVHRAHASTEGVARFAKETAAGLLLEKEVDFLTRALQNPAPPFVAVIGGAKVSDKLGVIEALLDKADRLLIGGAMSYTFLRARGEATGTSLVEEDRLDWARGVMQKAGDRLLLPTDHVVADRLAEDAEPAVVAGAIPAGKMGLDVGPETRARYSDAVREARTVIWNGPMGVFEIDAFAAGTRAVAQALAEATARGALTVVGGGDSVAAINEAGLADRVSHVSTGGGAMLEFVEGKALPGVEVLKG
jgi:phosphoglycerate kinase